MYSTPIAYFPTWTTYGTWLPGDQRGWVDAHRHETMVANLLLEDESKRRMRSKQKRLSDTQREVVRGIVKEHCTRRGWRLLALHVATNHVHVVVNSETDPKMVASQLKAWCSRRLSEALKPDDEKAPNW